ncbi:MAG: DUF4097 domain-containing protein [Syntrophobacteraceae bacterium]|nr:DUF4097 domain-containing protein [Syntrophobacteraceae bacterium]
MSKVKLLIVLGITVLFLAASLVFAGAEYKEDFAKTLSLKAGDRFSLENVNGGVSIATWKDNKVEIKAVKTARKREADLKEVEIRVDEGAGSVSVKAIWPKFPRRADVSVEFEIKVPEGVVLDEIETVNGGIGITGPYMRINAGSTNGSVTIESASGELSASTTNGGISVIRFEGRVEADTTNGNVRLEDLTFKGGLTAETTNGSIKVSLTNAEGLNADLRAHTTNGSVTIDFPITLQNLKGSKKHIEGKIGEGGPLIELETTNGSIRITK